MKKMNLLVMSLVSAAALSFTSCSSNDDLAGDAGQEKVDGFYMTLTVQTPNASGTRTSVLTPTENATAEEAAITNGTLYLVNDKNEIAFHEDLSKLDWSGAVGEGESVTKKDGSKTYEIKVPKVEAGKTYHVYFLAGSNKPVNGMNFAATNNNFFTAKEKFASPFADKNDFAMFNQNDAQVNGNGYSVTFSKANNNNQNPAKVTYTSADGNTTQKDAAIKVERVVARIDAPIPGTSTVLADAPADASAALKVAMKDAKEKVAEIKLLNYAVSNLANKSYVMQTWNSSELIIPDGISYFQPTAHFGEKYDYKDGGFTTIEKTDKNYVFENNSTTAPTTMYFEYKVTLKDMTGADFTDEDGEYAGTFYRYNNVIYTSFKQIFKDYEGVQDLFAKGENDESMKTKLKEDIKDEAKLAEFREKYNIEVFKGGKTYYKHVIKDNHINGIIQRNSIYRLNINNIFNVGAQVPNGIPTENEYYYLNVTVTVNPWVLNKEDVNLQ